MKRRILGYMNYIDQVIKDNQTGLSYEEIIEEHKLQLSFFMHERLIHLLVTLTFALLAFFTFFAMVITEFSVGIFLLFVALMVLLVPYIMHYYLLENGVQKMYRQYDTLKQLSYDHKKGNVKLFTQSDK